MGFAGARRRGLEGWGASSLARQEIGITSERSPARALINARCIGKAAKRVVGNDRRESPAADKGWTIVTPPISYWHDSLEPGDTLTPRAALPGNRKTDVVIVGAGFGGLWMAYYLLKADPSRQVVVIEAETAGFGASGRNGGWCVPEAGASLDVLDKDGGKGAGAALQREMFRAVDEVGEVARRENIDCGYAKGGALWLASDTAQLGRLTDRIKVMKRHGLDAEYDLLSPAATIAKVNATGMYGSIFTPHAAALHPARLARGLARAVERMGGTVHEKTPALKITGRQVVTPTGTIDADVVVRATEAYTASIEGHDRAIAPIGNYVIATEPIPENLWAEIGLRDRELFEDTPIYLAYGQRTADNRIAWGGRGANYWYNSRVPPSPMQAPQIAERLRVRLIERFPMLDKIKITHHWGGVLGMTRDLRSSVGYDRETGEAWAGGFGGAGVAPSNAAGRTLAELITGVDSERTKLPWVNHRSPPWESEPQRWIGVTYMLTRLRVFEKLGLNP
jgi:glycine/D-amino acid oxidase-like deaminating enzyme